jgi:hypothetical protein
MNVGKLSSDFHIYRIEDGLKTCEHRKVINAL